MRFGGSSLKLDPYSWRRKSTERLCVCACVELNNWFLYLINIMLNFGSSIAKTGDKKLRFEGS